MNIPKGRKKVIVASALCRWSSPDKLCAASHRGKQIVDCSCAASSRGTPVILGESFEPGKKRRNWCRIWTACWIRMASELMLAVSFSQPVSWNGEFASHEKKKKKKNAGLAMGLRVSRGWKDQFVAKVQDVRERRKGAGRGPAREVGGGGKWS